MSFITSSLFKSSVSIVLVSLLSGCSGKQSVPVNNTSLTTKSSLYIPFDNQTQSFKMGIQNKVPREGFRINNFSPVGFSTGMETFGTIGLWDGDTSYKRFSKKADRSKYYSTHSYLDLTDTIVSVGLFPLWALIGFPTRREGYFEHELFDEDAKNFVSKNSINRNDILISYQNLLDTATAEETPLKNEIYNAKIMLHDMYNKYKNAYAMRPKISDKFLDHTGFYNNEDISESITFREKSLTEPMFRYDINFQEYIDQSFPCNSTNACVNNMSKSKQLIVSKAPDKKQEIKKLSDNQSAQYHKTLQDESSVLTVDFRADKMSKTFGNKTLHYLVKAPGSVPTKAKELKVTYEIQDVDFKDVYPVYANANKDIQINFNPKTKMIKLTNNTQKFIEIDSISLYYNNDIYTIDSNQELNYAKELSPDSKSEFALWREIPNSEYKKLKRTEAEKITIKFGFAIKYSIDNSSKNETLYKVEKSNLAKLLS